MTSVHSVITVTLQGLVVDAGGFVTYKVERGRVEWRSSHVDDSNASRWRYSRWYRFFEGAWLRVVWAWAEPFDSPEQLEQRRPPCAQREFGPCARATMEDALPAKPKADDRLDGSRMTILSTGI